MFHIKIFYSFFKQNLLEVYVEIKQRSNEYGLFNSATRTFLRKLRVFMNFVSFSLLLVVLWVDSTRLLHLPVQGSNITFWEYENSKNVFIIVQTPRRFLQLPGTISLVTVSIFFYYLSRGFTEEISAPDPVVWIPILPYPEIRISTIS